MRLIDLDPCLQRHSIEHASINHGQPQPDGTIRWGGFLTTVWRQVDNLADADRVSFLCPKCFSNNGGRVGTHWIAIDLAGRRTPDKDCVRNSEGHPVRWEFTGTCLEDLALSPSIQVIGGCNWHGFVYRDGVVTC